MKNPFKGTWCWRKAIGLPSPYIAKHFEIAPGVPRPSYILAKMLAKAVFSGDLTEIKQDFSEKRYSSGSQYDYYDYTCKSASGKEIKLSWHERRNAPFVYIEKIEIDGKDHNYTLGEDEKILQAALSKALRLRVEANRAKTAERMQQKALDAIELMNDIPKPAPSGGPHPVRGCPCSICEKARTKTYERTNK